MSDDDEMVERDAHEADAAVGRRVHMLMWDHHVSQTTLAAELGIEQSGLSKKLRGKRPWSLTEVITVARELGTTVAYLVGEAGDPGEPGGRTPPEPSSDDSGGVMRRLREIVLRPSLTPGGCLRPSYPF